MKGRLLASLFGIVLIGFGQGAHGFFHKAPASRKLIAVEMKEFRFIPDRITIDAGRINFTIRNSGVILHVFQITGPGVNTHIALPPDTSTTVDVLLSVPGEYTLICPIPAHPEEGMQGSILSDERPMDAT
jgi:plastocyanin